VRETVRALAQRGTVLFLPTVVTAPWKTYTHTLPILAQAAADPEIGTHIAGVHLEGPFLSPQDGARGVHPKAHLRLPDPGELETLFELSGGTIRLLTLAPELPGALALVQRAVDLGIAVAIGHTMAGSQAVREAVAAGARLSTHLGNGCPNLLHRHENPLWPQLANPNLSAMLITDGHHLPADFVRTVLAVKGSGGAIVTSDAAPAAGLPPGDYELFGLPVRLEASGRLHSPTTQTLAGSAATMLDCMNWLASLAVLDEAGLWAVGRENALAVLGLDSHTIPDGEVCFEDNRFSVSDHFHRYT
jgi:N-acetylglucosamine-6-phosphate deacetylase